MKFIAMIIALSYSLCLRPIGEAIISMEESLELDSFVIPDHLGDGLSQSKI
jgi:hypothetical protein